MLKRVAIATAGLAIGLASHAAGAPIFHAGAWEDRSSDRPPARSCFPADFALDRMFLARTLVIPGAKCPPPAITGVGSVMNYSISCDISGAGHMSINGTVTPTGTDSYTIHSHTRLAGGPIKMADSDSTSFYHRVGACRPGDRRMLY